MRKSIIGVNFYQTIQQKNSKRPFKYLTINPPVSWSLPIAYSPHFKWWYPVLLVFLPVVTQYERHLDATSVIQSQPPSSWPHQNNYDVLRPATCCSGSRKEAYYKKKTSFKLPWSTEAARGRQRWGSRDGRGEEREGRQCKLYRVTNTP